MKECVIFRGSKYTLTPPTYFQGIRPQTPGSTPYSCCEDWPTADLHAYFRQADLGGEFFAAVDVRVVGLVERLLELMKLERRERRPIAAMLLAVSADVVVRVVATVASVRAVAQSRPRFRLTVVCTFCRPKS